MMALAKKIQRGTHLISRPVLATLLCISGLIVQITLVPEGLAQTQLKFDPASGKWIKAGPRKRSSLLRGGSRSLVPYSGKARKGTILIDTGKRTLLHILPNAKAMRYPIGVGRQGFTWAGTERISRKEEWPSWTPPKEMRVREATKGKKLPARMEGGPENPLGARALYLGNTLFRIHGTNQPETIGRALSSGCIRMNNDDVVHLFDNVKIGTRVVVRQ